jgi:hypothetical protein
MKRGTIIYIVWCAIIVLLFALSAQRGWSPFADGGRGGGVYVRGVGGPRHK